MNTTNTNIPTSTDTASSSEVAMPAETLNEITRKEDDPKLRPSTSEVINKKGIDGQEKDSNGSNPVSEKVTSEIADTPLPSTTVDTPNEITSEEADTKIEDEVKVPNPKKIETGEKIPPSSPEVVDKQPATVDTSKIPTNTSVVEENTGNIQAVLEEELFGIENKTGLGIPAEFGNVTKRNTTHVARKAEATTFVARKAEATKTMEVAEVYSSSWRTVDNSYTSAVNIILFVGILTFLWPFLLRLLHLRVGRRN